MQYDRRKTDACYTKKEQFVYKMHQFLKTVIHTIAKPLLLLALYTFP